MLRDEPQVSMDSKILEDWSGNLFDFFRVNAKLSKDIKTPFMLDGVVRVDDTPVHQALREALANCLVNADFYLPRGIVIKKDADTIVLENPGSIRTGKAQMLKGGISDPRNASILKMLNLIGIGERAGSGVPDIFATWKQQNWKTPTVEEQYNPDRTIVTLPLSEQDTIHVATQENTHESAENTHVEQENTHVEQENIHVKGHKAQVQRLLEFCEVPRSRTEIQKHLGLTNRSYVTKLYIKPLLDSGELRMLDPGKPKSPKQKYIKS